MRNSNTRDFGVALILALYFLISSDIIGAGAMLIFYALITSFFRGG